MRTEGLSTQVACRVLEVSESGFYAWRSRPPSARSIRHAWLTDIICQVHQQSRGVHGARRVHAELTSGHQITVGHNAVAMQMRRAGTATPNHRPCDHRSPFPSRVLVDRPRLLALCYSREEPHNRPISMYTHPTGEAPPPRNSYSKPQPPPPKPSPAPPTHGELMATRL